MVTQNAQNTQNGFVLPTALVLLALLTMMALTVYFGSLSTNKMSRAAQQTTQAYYYAETASNYMLWVLNSDAELDSYTGYQGGVSGNYLRNGAGVAPFGEPSSKTGMNAITSGDYRELLTGLSNPGPVEISDTANANPVACPNATVPGFDGVSGQVMYFDNTPLAARAIVWPDAKTNPPIFDNISTELPRYIRIDIDAYGNVSPDLPQLPHANPPVVGDDIPENGAIVWLTASMIDAYGNERDTQIIPLDPYVYTAGQAACTPIDAYTIAAFPAGQTVSYPNGQTLAAYPSTAPVCNVINPISLAAQQAIACDAYANVAADGGWIGPGRYQIAVYALGYVNGKPMRLVRKTW